jgi:hypothetical protein
MGQRVGQSGSGARSEEVLTPEGTQAVPAAALGGGEDVFLAFSEQEDEQRLREAARDGRSPNLRGYEPPDGEEIGSRMRVFKQFQAEVRRTYIAPPHWSQDRRRAKIANSSNILSVACVASQSTPGRPHH